MTRKWLIAKGYRKCDNSRCVNYAGEAGKPCQTVLDSVTGTVRTTCSVCRQTSEFQCREWKEARACTSCKYVRNVTVHQYQDGTTHARDMCDACEMMQSVAVHRHTADRLEAKAHSIIIGRKQKA
jgi:hypothetical protein